MRNLKAANGAARPPLLAAVTRVCALHPAVASLDHVAQAIDACLDPSRRWSVPGAVRSGSVRLLDRVLWNVSQDTTVDPFVRELWLRRGLQAAVKRGDAAMVRVLHAFHPGYLAGNFLELAAERRDLQLFQWLYDHRPDERDCISSALIAAAGSGCLSILQYLLDKPEPHVCPSTALRAAVQHGHCDAAQYLTSKGVRAHLIALDDEIARHGHLEMVKLLHAHDNPGVFTSAAMDAAAGAGHFDIVQFLHENRNEGCRSWAMDSAAAGGYIEILDYLFANRRDKCTARAVNGAARNGHVHVLEWLLEKFSHRVTIWTPEAATSALVHGQYDALAWLQTHFPHQCARLNPYAALEIAKEGNLKGLQMLHEMHGTEVRWSPRVIDVAAASGDMKMIQWLWENRPNDATGTTALDRAAEAGQLEMVQWLHAQGVACTPWAMDKAAAGGHLDVVQWLHSNRSEGCTTAPIIMAAAAGHLEVIQWLHENRTEGCTTHAMDAAAIGGHLEVVMWLHEHRTEGCTIEAIDRSAALDNWEVVQWLVQHETTTGCSPNGVRDAMSRGRLRVMKFLQSRFPELHIDPESVSRAGRNGYLEVLKWAVEDLGIDDDELLRTIRTDALAQGHFHVVEWIDARTSGEVDRLLGTLEVQEEVSNLN